MKVLKRLKSIWKNITVKKQTTPQGGLFFFISSPQILDGLKAKNDVDFLPGFVMIKI